MPDIRFIGGCIAAALLMQTAPALACTCDGQSVSAAKKSADVVFAGRVEEVTLVDDQSGREPRIIVRFTVGRAWKGPVTQSFTMHSNIEFSSCAGFFKELLTPGSTLMVYGYQIPASVWKGGEMAGAPNAGSFTVMDEARQPIRQDLVDAVSDDGVVYTTDICTRTGPVIYAVDDFKKLGKGVQEFGPLDQLPDAEFVKAQHEANRYIPNALPDRCQELQDGRVWKVLRKPPPNHAELIARVESEFYGDQIPIPHPTKYRDRWVRDADGVIGVCRLSVDPDIVCGEAQVYFPPGNFPDGRPKIGGGLRTYCLNPDGTRYEAPRRDVAGESKTSP